MGDERSPSGDAPPTAVSLRIDRSAPARRRRRGAGSWVLALLVVGAAGGLAWSFLGRAGGLLSGLEVAEGRVLRSSADLAAERTTASGYVVARTRAAISPKYPGRLARLLVDVGDLVEKGALLAELDHAELDAAVERGEAEVARARAEAEAASLTAAERASAAEWARTATQTARAALREAEARRDDAVREADRLERLLRNAVVTESERDRAAAQAKVQQAQADRAAAEVASAVVEERRAAEEATSSSARVDAARAGMGSAEATLRETRSRRDDAFIRAQFRGRVLRKEAEVGEVIAPATTGGGSTRGALLTLADFETLEMEVDVVERDVSLVAAGAPCRIVLDAYPREPFPGKVRQVVPTADRQKATVQVKVSFDAPDPRVLPEMGGKVVFLASGARVSTEAERLTVPAAALAEREGRRGVFVIVKEGSDFRVKFAGVESGGSENGRTVVSGGVAGGERVVVGPPPGLKDGDLVSVRETP